MEISKFKSALKNISLLIASNDEHSRNTIEQMFSVLLKGTYLAQDVEIAYSLFEKNAPDIIITDFQIPSLDGKNLIKKISEDNKTVPIIVITSYKDALSEDECKFVSGVLEKPINFIKFVKLLDDSIQGLNK